MALSVSVATIKRKCKITVSDFDTEIDETIDEQLPAIEFALEPSFVDDIGNTGLQATLNLGASEIVAGEFLAQQFREPGASEELDFYDIRFGVRNWQFGDSSVSDPFGLREIGWLRLAPYLKAEIAMKLGTRANIIAKTPMLEDEGGKRW